MNPSYGIIMWVVIGALAGWLGSIIMGTNARQGAVANVIVGVLGALVGGYLTRLVLGPSATNNGFVISTLIALLGSIIVIAIWRAFSRHRRTA